MKRLPRAPSDRTCALSGRVYNDIASAIEANSRLTVAPPLMLDDTPAGKVLRISLPPTVGFFVLTGSATRYGTYTAHRLLPPTSQFDTTTASTFSSSDIGTSTTDSVYLINVREEGKSTHDLDSGGTFLPMKFFGVFNQMAADGKLCYLIDGRQGEACA